MRVCLWNFTNFLNFFLEMVFDDTSRKVINIVREKQRKERKKKKGEGEGGGFEMKTGFL